MPVYHPRRYPRVAWLWDSDLDEGARPLWTYDQQGLSAFAWLVELYEEGLPGEATLMVSAKHDVVALSIPAWGTRPRATIATPEVRQTDWGDDA